MGLWYVQRVIGLMGVDVDKRLKKMRIACHLLPDPANEIVWNLVGDVDRLQNAVIRWFEKARDRGEEVRRLRLAISRQKMYLNKQIDDLERLIKRHQYGSHRYVDLTDEREQLIGVRNENRRIAKELKLDERVNSDA